MHALLLSVVVALAQSGEDVKEPETGVVFAPRLTAPEAREGAREQHLLGVGVREKWVFDVYAIGVYVDPVAAAAALGDRLSAVDPVAAAGKHIGRLNDVAVPRSLRLVMVRDVDGEDMREAFEDVLRPRIEKRLSGEREKTALAALASFRKVFDRPAVEGQVMRFAWHPAVDDETPGALVTEVDGKVVHRSADAELARALFDVYLGADPLTDARPRCLKALPGLVAGGSELAAAELRAEAAGAGAGAGAGATDDG